MLSIIIPIYNEEKIIPELIKRLDRSANDWAEYEVIFVDDGSRDGSYQLLKQALDSHHNYKIIRFSRNFGHQIAITAGLNHSSGDGVVIIDGDLQDPPEFIKKMIDKWQEGYKIVYAIRASRKENIFKCLAYKIYYRLLKAMADIDIALDSGDFCLMDRQVVDLINSLPEKNRFIRGLRAWSGFSRVGVPYERDRRFAGKSKFSLRKLLHLWLDGIVNFSTLPLKLSTYIGFIIATLSFLSGVYLMISKLYDNIDPKGWTSIMLAVFFIGGIQLIIIGMMGEYVARIYIEAQGRPLYVIEAKDGFNKKLN